MFLTNSTSELICALLREIDWLIYNSPDIKEVLLFPAMKPDIHPHASSTGGPPLGPSGQI
jgi:hypothetical protein